MHGKRCSCATMELWMHLGSVHFGSVLGIGHAQRRLVVDLDEGIANRLVFFKSVV